MLAVTMFVACKNTKGEEAKVSDKVEKSTDAKGTSYAVAADASIIAWNATKTLGGGHNGTIKISEGSVTVDGGAVVGGNFTIDMNSISVLDIEDAGKRGYLETHLKGLDDKSADDFFNVNKYPTAKYEITKVIKKEGDENANSLVYGNLTLRDITKSVSFSANINVADGVVNVNTPDFKFDRTEFGIKYNSPSFFDDLKEKAINNDVGLNVTLVAK